MSNRVIILCLTLVVLLTGCRGLSRNTATTATPVEAPRFTESMMPSNQPPPIILGTSATPTTTYKPPFFSNETVTITERPLSESASAFKPVTPENLRQSEVPSTVPTTPLAAPLPTASTDRTDNGVDKLARRVVELEKALAESKAEAQRAQKAAEEAANRVAAKPEPLPVVVTTVSPPTEKPVQPAPQKTPRKAPVLSIPGVSVAAEADRIRFRIVDKAVFVPGTYRIKPEAEETFRKIVAEIRNLDPDAALEIEGHTDSLNTDPANPMQKHEVSSVKAVVVMEYFVKSLLWNNERIRTSAHGAARPVGDNGTPEGRAENNRIEIVVFVD